MTGPSFPVLIVSQCKEEVWSSASAVSLRHMAYADSPAAIQNRTRTGRGLPVSHLLVA